ncbi:MAG: hypothetical protein GYB42_13090 [Alphaproteobacteria bacterium]|nr:hypothetical protein [Alphaproteobacteria bacterium]
MRCLVFICVLLAPSAFADDAAHLIAFSQGRYSEAVDLADAAPNEDNLAFAARALLAEAMSAPDHSPPQALVIRAEDHARAALELNPDHVEARLQLAIALSLRARPMTTREARRSGYGDDARDLVRSVLVDDPDNLYAHGFMAVWNLEVVRRGGGLGAAIMGASVKQARRHYHAAIALAPDDASTHWQYAKALTALDADKYRDEIDTALNAALAASANSELEALMQARASQLRLALQTLPHHDCETLAERML